jgi:hypothetical protein
MARGKPTGSASPLAWNGATGCRRGMLLISLLVSQAEAQLAWLDLPYLHQSHGPCLRRFSARD